MAVIGPGMAGLSEDQQRLYLLMLTLIHRFRGTGFDAVRDSDVSAAVSALAATYETEARGLIYEHRADSAPAQRLTADLRAVLDRLGRERPSAFARDAATVLRRMERLAADARRLLPPEPDVLLDTIGRVAVRLTAAGFVTETESDAGTPPPASQSSIIVP